MAGTSRSHADLWVWVNGRKLLAVYRAEDPSGLGFYVKYSQEQHSSIAWLAPHKVKFIKEPRRRVFQEPSEAVRYRLRREIAAEEAARAAADA